MYRVQTHTAPRALDFAESSARSIQRLLGGRVWGAVQLPSKKYGQRVQLPLETLQRHFIGELSIAIRCVENGYARLLAFDVDERGPERVAALRHVLGRRGLAKHAIVTSGSDPDRAKVIIFCRPVNQAAAVRFAQEIAEEARLTSGWGIERAHTVDMRPTAGEGGLLRIGGRNVFRDGPIERISNLETGEVVSLSQCSVADLKLPLEPEPIPTPRIPPYAQEWMEHGMPWGKKATQASF